MIGHSKRLGRIVALATGLALLGLARALPAAPEPAPFAFTDAQLAHGKVVYLTSCSGCHGARLEGGGSFALAGQPFARRWEQGDRSYGDLAHALHAMPKTSPGSLPEADYDALMAFILSSNGFAPAAMAQAGDPRVILTAPGSAPAGTTPRLKAPKMLPAKPETVTASETSAPNDAELLAASSSDWLMFNRSYAGNRASTLDQINAGNVARLQPVCMMSLGVLGSFQGSPLIYKGMGYVGSTYGVWAFDAATCQRKWSYSYTPDGAEGIATSRGIALYDGKVFKGTPDGHLIALDMTTGKLLWDTHVADGAQGYSIGAAPVAFEGKVIVGLAGGDYGNTGHVYAFDARTGDVVWTFDVIDRKTWPKGSDNGGGGTWTSVAIDPVKRQVFVPVGNPSPDYYLPARPGSNLYTNSVVALDVATGKVAWYVQQLAQDYHDWDTSAAPILYDQDGRHYMAVGTKAGYVYIYDRDSHQLIAKSNVVPRLNDTLPFSDKPLYVCPGTASGVEWNGPAYDPASKSLFVNTVHWCATWTAKAPEGPKPGSWYVEADLTMDPPEKLRGQTYGLDAATGRELWKREAPKPMVGAITPTAGGVVLTGGGDGMFLALDPKTGRELYRFNTGSAISGGVATYMVGGRQYVAVATGGVGLQPFGEIGAPTVILFALPSDTP